MATLSADSLGVEVNFRMTNLVADQIYLVGEFIGKPTGIESSNEDSIPVGFFYCLRLGCCFSQ